MIERNLYTEYKGHQFVLIDHVEDPSDFRRWLEGQNCPDIPDIDAAYTWDYERYLIYRDRQKRKKE